MNRVHLVPKSPNTQNCITLGCWQGKLFLAYGCDRRICILQANTLIIHQLTEEFENFIHSIAFARTGGRLAIGLENSIIILVPKNSIWEFSSKISNLGRVQCITWSFFGDCFLACAEKTTLWSLDNQLETGEIWNSTTKYDRGCVSPDGRLLAFSQQTKVHIYYKDHDFSLIKLNHQTRITWICWKDIATAKLYRNSYNPNALLVMCEDGWIKVWSEYYSPTGLGFNIVFQMRTQNGLACWIQNYDNMENNICILSTQHELLKKQKAESLSLYSKSCLLREEKTEPEHLLYGAVMKERIPVEWLFICEDNRVLFYCCEGIGAYPVTAINIRLHLEIPIKRDIWGIHSLPLYAIKECEEMQLLGLNKEKDFVRWRKKFDKKNEEEFELTSVRGGHDSKIIKIICHKTLPLVCSIDESGLSRIWSSVRSMPKESEAVQELMHWGVLKGQILNGAWLDTFALIVVVRTDDLALFKWQSPSIKELKLPSVKWEEMVTWPSQCRKVAVSKIEAFEDTFSCLIAGLSYEKVIVWKVKYDEKFVVEKHWEVSGRFLNIKLYSYLCNSIHYTTNLYTLTSSQVKAYNLDKPEDAIFIKTFQSAVNFAITGIITIITPSKLVFFGHDGSDQGQLENVHENHKVFFFSQDSIECIGVLNGKNMTVMARQPLKIVGESEMQWVHVANLKFKDPFDLCSINNFQQFITSVKTDIQVYVNEENATLSQLLSTISDIKPFFHPLFLFELLRVQKENVVKKILNKMHGMIEELNYTLDLDFNDFVDDKGLETFTEQTASELKNKINEKCMVIPGLEGDIMLISQLIGVIDFLGILDSQSRSLDEFAKLFFLNVKMFKFAHEQKVPQNMKTTCLSSMDIAWALNSEHQDTFMSLLFSQVPDWNTMKMYGIGIWLKNPQKLKKLIEDIAMADYRKNKEPKNIALWYMALNKKNILPSLFKNGSDTDKKIAAFMQNDFSNKEWQVKAQKNAYELRRQMKYELSAVFFILAGCNESAIEILAECLFDPQLALVIARLKEGDGSPLYQKVINDYFLSNALKEKDPWLASISYTLIGKYADSIMCLQTMEEPPKIVINAWNSHTAPLISGFHPSLKKYAKLMRKVIMVRRDCEQYGIDLEHFKRFGKDIASRSAKSYLRGGLPVLALLKVLKDPADYSLTETAVKSYLMVVAKHTEEPFLSIKTSNLNKRYSKRVFFLVSQVKFCSEKFGIPIRRLIDFISAEFYKNDLRSYQCAFLAGCGFTIKGAEALLHQAALVHIVLSRVSRDPLFKCSQSALELVSLEMKACIRILIKPGEPIPPSQRCQLMHIGISIYLCIFLQCYQLGSCTSCLSCLQALETFVNTVDFTDVAIQAPPKPPDQGIVSTWLRYLMTNKLLKIIEKFKSKEVDSWLDASLSKFGLIDSTEKTVECALGPGRGLKKRPLMSISKLRTRIKSMLRRTLLQINNLISNQSLKTAQRITEIFSVKNNTLPTEISDFFTTFDEFRDFDLYFEGNSQLYKLVQASAQSISSFVYEKPGKVSEALEKEGDIYQESVQENVSLFKNGLELFKTKDPVIGFAINNTDKKDLVVVSNSKKDKIREVNLEHCLIFKKFNAELELENDDPESYADCIKQFESMQSKDAYIYNPSISASRHHLYAPQSEEFEQEMKLPPATWHRSPLKPLLASLSSFKSRQEKVEKIASHPMLPLYVTGNELLTLWQFNRPESLQDFATSSSGTSKITSIKFNSFGDKLGACDAQGNFYLYKFDLQPTSFQPQLTLKNYSGLKASNFCFLNLGSVIATVGHKPKGFLSIYDTLLPPSRPPIHTENIGGKFICFVSRYQQLLLSGKKGKIIKYDLRMRSVVETYESKHEHISDMKLGPSDITFITGGTEGMVKIWDTRGSTLRECIDTTKKNKSKGVSQIECINNTLFASSQDGTVRLLRIIQQ